MSVQTHSKERHVEGVTKLSDAMAAAGIEVKEAADGRRTAPRQVNGQQLDLFGTAKDGKSAVGVVAFVDELPKEPTKRRLQELTAWAKDPGAPCFVGVIGQPGKGFAGMEETAMLEVLKREGWQIVEV